MQTGITLSLVGLLAGLLTYRFRGVVSETTRDKLMRMWFHYQWGMFTSGLNGAALAVKGTLGVAAGAAFNPQQIQAPNPAMCLYVFCVAFALNALDWFGKNPLPTKIDDTTPPFPTTSAPVSG